MGRSLLAHPHFIGTIHGFVNEFLAVPWLRSLDRKLVMIDDGIVEIRRRRFMGRHQFQALNRYVTAVESKTERNIVAKWRVASPEFLVHDGNGAVFKNPCPAAKQLSKLVECVIDDGYYRHCEMFMWAKDILDKLPDVTCAMRERFPVLFLDEAQDNSEQQSSLLHQVFMAGHRGVVRQRFGDPNQEIYDFFDTGATTHPFPDNTVPKVNLPNSHRFGQRIADFADPLGLDPYVLKGQGPRKRLASGSAGRKAHPFPL